MRRLFLVVGLAVVFTQSAGSGMALAGGVGAIASAKAYGVNIIGYDNCPKSENAQRIAVLGTYGCYPEAKWHLRRRYLRSR